ncbi:MAG: regulatory iron-sulfur-containing complex subunit RicT [Candidatus Gracilibacteria bacterium]|nr:regulatory iron-sulfur-containing complex subunit RicT [Candidatus Gracilibacteria bacterium]
MRYLDREISDPEKVLKNSKILRRLTPNDEQKIENHFEQAKGALDECIKLIAKYELSMQAFRASYSFDGSKVHFMFVSDDRVDFRELVKDLAKILKKQIYLRQVGPRDKAKFVGGYGKCGRKLCCNSFLNRLESINMEMVRDQALEGKGSPKLSGACGKLLCCLKYEVETYRELKKGLPSIGSIVRLKKSFFTSGPSADVIGLDILNRKLKVRTEEGEIAVIDFSEVDKVLKENSFSDNFSGERAN